MVDRVATQVLYAVTGIVLARLLPTEDFGLVGAVLIFQAFASLLIDSGFSFALLQRKQPTRLDYSSVFWFNMALSVTLYLIIYACAPLIPALFQNDQRLVPITRVLMLSLILNSSSLVQVNRLIKSMDTRMVAVSNSISLAAGGVVGIGLAVAGAGAWAIVWQTLVGAGVKSIVLWTTGHWWPLLKCSWQSLRSYMGLGTRMMCTSFLTTTFQHIYGFIIGNRVGMAPLGYYTQADKWSKMGITAITQVLSSTFLPGLSAVQDDAERFRNVVRKINRFTAYVTFPAMLGLFLMATPIFHTIFGTKWDASIILFRILLVRGIFFILNSLYNNYILALGKGGMIVRLEIIRDVTAILALVITLPYAAITTPGDPVYGIGLLLWGQLAATFVAWIATLVAVVRYTGISAWGFISDNMPYLAQTLVIIPVAYYAGSFFGDGFFCLLVEAVVALGLYLLGNMMLRSKIQKEVIGYMTKGKKS